MVDGWDASWEEGDDGDAGMLYESVCAKSVCAEVHYVMVGCVVVVSRFFLGQKLLNFYPVDTQRPTLTTTEAKRPETKQKTPRMGCVCWGDHCLLILI